jgi:oligosaccharide repeat unit polymerase
MIIKFNNETLFIVTCTFIVLFVHMFANAFTGVPVSLSMLLIMNKVWSVSKKGRYELFSPAFAFLIGYFILNFSLPIIGVFGEVSYRIIISENVSINAINSSVFYSFYGQVAFMLGANGYFSERDIETNDKRNFLPSISICKICSMLLFFLLLLLILTIGPGYFFGEYKGVYGRTGLGNFLFYLTQIIAVCSSALLLIRITNKGIRNSYFECILLSPYMILIFLYVISGDRGELIYILGPIGYVYASNSKRFKNISTIKFFSLILIFLFVIGFLRELRNESQSVFNISANQSFFSIIGIAMTNVGSSGLLLPAAIDEVENNGYVNGLFTLNAVLGAVPGLRGLLQETVNYGDDVFLESASLLTQRLYGQHSTTGSGTSSVADLYLDFGIWWLIIGHYLLGRLATNIKKWYLDTNSWAYHLTFAISIGVFATLARYAIIPMLIKYLLFPLLIMLIISSSVKHLTKIK